MFESWRQNCSKALSNCSFDRCAAGGYARAGVTEQPLDDVLWERLIKATPANG